MLFDHTRTITNGAADPDPLASPELIVGRLPFVGRRRAGDSERINSRLIFALDAPVAEGLTVTVYAFDEHVRPEDGGDGWYIVEAGVAVTGRTVSYVDIPSNGGRDGHPLYVRVTADTLTVPRTLKVAAVQPS